MENKGNLTCNQEKREYGRVPLRQLAVGNW